jgi:uncharacterized protein YndB with AHSA1/START domain
MSHSLIVKNSITIHAPASKVWEALVNPALTKKYMFGCEIISDFKVGSPFLWKGVFEGKELIAVKGNVVDIDEGRYLAFTTFDPNSTIEDIPENYTTVTYNLTPEKSGTTLAVTQGDFATVAEGERRFAEVNNGGEGWNPILVEIKKLVETELV